MALFSAKPTPVPIMMHDQTRVHMQDLVRFLQTQDGSGIVYSHLRATADWVASKLIDADIDAAAYHAGKPAQKRKAVQRDWADGSLACVVATIVCA